MSDESARIMGLAALVVVPARLIACIILAVLLAVFDIVIVWLAVHLAWRPLP